MASLTGGSFLLTCTTADGEVAAYASLIDARRPTRGPSWRGESRGGSGSGRSRHAPSALLEERDVELRETLLLHLPERRAGRVDGLDGTPQVLVPAVEERLQLR